MDYCGAYREIDLAEFNQDARQIISLTEAWGVTITDDGKVRIPVCHYDDVRALLSKKKKIP